MHQYVRRGRAYMLTHRWRVVLVWLYLARKRFTALIGQKEPSEHGD